VRRAELEAFGWRAVSGVSGGIGGECWRQGWSGGIGVECGVRAEGAAARGVLYGGRGK
jgi:hypothetical protein